MIASPADLRPDRTARRLAFGALLLVVLIATGAGPLAGEAESQAGASAEDPATAGQPDPPAAEPAAAAGSAGEAGVFVPTEEISEDFAVSFPVDI